jgi:exodeoxyribonuclease VII small subunit
MAGEKQKTFEASLQELEKIVRNLENGDLPLEESLKLFEDGVKISRECQERLNQAERRIEILMKDGEGNPALEVVKAEDLRGEQQQQAEPKVKRRIVFDTDDESPF